MKEYRPGQGISEYTTLLHGDVSGIQDFIFNVRSEGAAKTLKARSFFVQALATLCINMIEDRLGEENCLLFYNGGGGFSVFCKNLSEETFADLQKTIQSDLQDMEIYLTLSRAELDAQDFSKTWNRIRRTARRDKLRKFINHQDAFTPQKRYKANDEHWKKFAGRLIRSQGFDDEGIPGAQKIVRDTITLFGKHLRLTHEPKSQHRPDDINWHLPVWDRALMDMDATWMDYINRRNQKDDPDEEENNVRPGMIIDFETMGHFAKKRTGTDKIAVLKMDVDDLGVLFSTVKHWDQSKKTSDALKYFFEQALLKLWQGGFTSGITGEHVSFQQTIYPIFSGGDDCLIIGAWDAVFEFALAVYKAFQSFMKSRLVELQLQKLPTLSAAIIVVDSRFPVVRMGALAEEALSLAKSAADGTKNRVFVFGKVLTWTEFEKAHSIANNLERLIKVDNEPRSILQRIRSSHTGFEKQMRRAIEEGRIHNPAVWRLMYYIRQSKNKDSLQSIIEEYQRALIEAVTKRIYTNADLFPVAARWAEFKTRKSDND